MKKEEEVKRMEGTAVGASAMRPFIVTRATL